MTLLSFLVKIGTFIFSICWTTGIMIAAAHWSQPGSPKWFFIWLVGTLAWSAWEAFYLLPAYEEERKNRGG